MFRGLVFVLLVGCADRATSSGGTGGDDDLTEGTAAEDDDDDDGDAWGEVEGDCALPGTEAVACRFSGAWDLGVWGGDAVWIAGSPAMPTVDPVCPGSPTCGPIGLFRSTVPDAPPTTLVDLDTMPWTLALGRSAAYITTDDATYVVAPDSMVSTLAATGRNLAASGDLVYWVDEDSGGIQRLVTTTGEVTEVAVVEGRALALAADGDTVAWAGYPDGEVSGDLWLSQPGGEPTTLVADAGLVLSIAVEADLAVYRTMDGELVRLDARRAVAPARLVDGGVVDFDLHAQSLYVVVQDSDSGSSAVLQIPPGASTGTPLYEADTAIRNVAVDDGFVYLATDDRIVRLPAD